MGKVRTIIDARGVTVDRVAGLYRATRLTGGGPGMHLETRMSDTLDMTLTTAAGWILEGEGIEALEEWLTVVVTLPGFGQHWDYIWGDDESLSFYEIED